MKNQRRNILALMLFLSVFMPLCINAQSAAPLRRPISTLSPAWLIHIDVWVKADPMKVIDLIPEDIRPYVIFNLALSVSDPGTGPYGINVNTPTIVESWLRACAERGVWAVIQPASGYECNLPYTHTTGDIYERFYQQYPNFLGYNFAEQCWGFGNDTNINERMVLLSDLIQLAAQYGGYLFVSHTQTISAPNLNALAFLKRNADFRYWAKRYKDNYITLEKYTTSQGFYDIESTSLGAFLSGYCGNYGMRFDNCGWTTVDSRKNIPFPEALGGMLIAEHFLLTGTTVQDGPELTWEMAIKSDGIQTSSDGYSSKKFKMADNFINHNLDLFRKQIDGSFRIPTKDEVVARTKVAYVNDATSGSNLNQYAAEPSLFTGLYAVDGEQSNNHSWTKSTGRYPSIPSIFQQGPYETGAFTKVVKKSNYSATWSTINAKIDDMNAMFPQEYTGNIYAGRIKNTWITYNPYMGVLVNGTTYKIENSPASGSIPFKYNTCTKMEISHSNYGYAVIKEFADKLDVYVNNFCSQQSSADVPLMRNTEIKIYGSIVQPTYTYNYRVSNSSNNPAISTESTMLADFETNPFTDSWIDGVYTLTVNHNSPIDITIQCSGAATDRLTDYPADPEIIEPAAPPIYNGPFQHEFEDFEYKNIEKANALSSTNELSDYTGMSYSVFGNNANACMRNEVNVPASDAYLLKTRYIAPNGNVGTVDLYVNGQSVATLMFNNTTVNSWQTLEIPINLNAGENRIEYKANAASNTLYLDNIVIERTGSGSGIQEPSPGNNENLRVLSEEYYTIMGQRVFPKKDNLRGVFIVKNLMSDGTAKSKILYLK